MQRTRIKICGLTRLEDVSAAVASGADALGFVFYDKSPRFVTGAQAASLLAGVPPLVTTVGLFVNASAQDVAAVTHIAAVAQLQFHGDESPGHCALLAGSANRPFMKVFRVRPDTRSADLLEYERQYRAASPLFSGLLLDTFVDAYGGAGKVFDWSLIPKEIAPRVVLSGGLNAQNATDAVVRVRPYGLDVSSGVEQRKGIKDAHKIAAFASAVRAADATFESENPHARST